MRSDILEYHPEWVYFAENRFSHETRRQCQAGAGNEANNDQIVKLVQTIKDGKATVTSIWPKIHGILEQIAAETGIKLLHL